LQPTELFGLLENINTSAFNAGDVLYVSDATPGTPTATIPSVPSLEQEIGTVLVSNATTGVIQVVARGVGQEETGTTRNFYTYGDQNVGGNTELWGDLNALGDANFGNIGISGGIGGNIFINNGRIGIQKPAPSTLFHIENNSAATGFGGATMGNTGIALINSNNTTNKPIGIEFGGYEGFTFGGIYGVADSLSGRTTGDIVFAFRNPSSDTSFTEAGRIAHEGRLGFGLGLLGAALSTMHLQNASSATTYGSSSISDQGVAVVNSNGTTGKPYGIQFGGYANTSFGGLYGVMDNAGGKTTGDIILAYRNATDETNFLERFWFLHEGLFGTNTVPVTDVQFHDSTPSAGTHTQMKLTNVGTGATSSDGITLGIGDLTADQDRAYLWFYEDGYLQIATNNSEKMRISSAGGFSFGNGYVATDPGAGNMILEGSLGINNTSPAAYLDVDGNAIFRQDVNIYGDLAVTGTLFGGSPIEFGDKESDNLKIIDIKTMQEEWCNKKTMTCSGINQAIREKLEAIACGEKGIEWRYANGKCEYSEELECNARKGLWQWNGTKCEYDFEKECVEKGQEYYWQDSQCRKNPYWDCILNKQATHDWNKATLECEQNEVKTAAFECSQQQDMDWNAMSEECEFSESRHQHRLEAECLADRSKIWNGTTCIGAASINK